MDAFTLNPSPIEAENERLRKALNRAKEQFSRISKAPAYWSNEVMRCEARFGLEQIKEDLGEL